MLLTHLKDNLRNISLVKVMERSIHSSMLIVENSYLSGEIQEVEYLILCEWYNTLNNEVSGLDLSADLTSTYFSKDYLNCN